MWLGIGWSLDVQAAAAKPNVVLIVVDDLGWADTGCYGSRFYQTPQIDRLAAQGVRFTAAYAAGPVCSPSRAALLTGKHPARLQLTDWLPGRQDRPSQKLLKPEIQRHLPLEEITMAEALRGAGYTTASIGKWHLGGPGFLPQDQGFDVNIAGDELGSPLSYFAPFQSGRRMVPGLETSRAGEYLTDRLTDEAERFIDANRDRPFFLYLSHFAVHIPLQAKDELVRRSQARSPDGPQTNVLYAAMMQSVDESVGRIRQKLDALNLSERTVLFFTSDNGGLSVAEGPHTPATSNLPLRAGKGYLYEGGIRVPLIVQWPGHGHANRVENAPVSGLDLFPTILEIAGLPAPRAIDGVSLVPLIEGQASPVPRSLYWHYPHYSNQGGAPSGAIRAGDFKLVQSFENGRLELFNVQEDPGETNDLAGRFPDRANALRREIQDWRQSVGAQMMEPNPEYQKTAGLAAQPVPQMADRRIFLHARDATIHGSTVRYEPEPHKNTIGYWTKAEDWVSWEFEANDPGTFSVEILQGCGTGSGGSDVEFAVDDQRWRVTVEETGGFQNFVTRTIGRLKVERPGRYTLTVKPRRKPGLAVMDLRAVTLQPVIP